MKRGRFLSYFHATNENNKPAPGSLGDLDLCCWSTAQVGSKIQPSSLDPFLDDPMVSGFWIRPAVLNAAPGEIEDFKRRRTRTRRSTMKRNKSGFIVMDYLTQSTRERESGLISAGAAPDAASHAGVLGAPRLR